MPVVDIARVIGKSRDVFCYAYSSKEFLVFFFLMASNTVHQERSRVNFFFVIFGRRFPTSDLILYTRNSGSSMVHMCDGWYFRLFQL